LRIADEERKIESGWFTTIYHLNIKEAGVQICLQKVCTDGGVLKLADREKIITHEKLEKNREILRREGEGAMNFGSNFDGSYLGYPQPSIDYIRY
jgi:hypothetical protein